MRLRFIHALSGRLPFYYGWIVLAAVCAASFSRQGPAVATLSIFIEPMTSEFGWSRTEISGAVSLGGILGAAGIATGIALAVMHLLTTAVAAHLIPRSLPH